MVQKKVPGTFIRGVYNWENHTLGIANFFGGNLRGRFENSNKQKKGNSVSPRGDQRLNPLFEETAAGLGGGAFDAGVAGVFEAGTGSSDSSLAEER